MDWSAFQSYTSKLQSYASTVAEQAKNSVTHLSADIKQFVNDEKQRLATEQEEILQKQSHHTTPSTPNKNTDHRSTTSSTSSSSSPHPLWHIHNKEHKHLETALQRKILDISSHIEYFLYTPDALLMKATTNNDKDNTNDAEHDKPTIDDDNVEELRSQSSSWSEWQDTYNYNEYEPLCSVALEYDTLLQTHRYRLVPKHLKDDQEFFKRYIFRVEYIRTHDFAIDSLLKQWKDMEKEVMNNTSSMGLRHSQTMSIPPSFTAVAPPVALPVARPVKHVTLSKSKASLLSSSTAAMPTPAAVVAENSSKNSVNKEKPRIEDEMKMVREAHSDSHTTAETIHPTTDKATHLTATTITPLSMASSENVLPSNTPPPAHGSSSTSSSPSLSPHGANHKTENKIDKNNSDAIVKEHENALSDQNENDDDLLELEKQLSELDSDAIDTSLVDDMDVSAYL